MYAVPASLCDAWTDATQEKRGAPWMFGATLVQLLPPSRVNCRLPSSVPAQIRFWSFGLSAIERIVQWNSARVLSVLISPPLAFCFSLSFVVRSGLITLQLEPPSVVLNSTFPP